MPQPQPVIGACLLVEDLETYRDWLFAKDRDVEIQSFTDADVLDGDWEPLARRGRELLDGHAGRTGIHGPFWGLPLNSPDPGIRAVVSRRILRGLDVCAVLGATQMVLHSPFTQWLHNNAPVNPGRREEFLAAFRDTLAAGVARAENEGVTLVLENIEDCDPASRVELARSFDSPSVRVSIDTGHAQCARTMSGAPPVDYFVIAAGAMLEHVHLQDVDGYADRHWPPGEGVIRWPAVFRALGDLGTNPRLLLELKDHGQIPDAMAFLEREGLGQ